MDYQERLRIEKRYHDEKYREHAVDPTTRGRVTRASRRFWSAVGEPTGLTILDFGCGNGWLGILMARRGNRVHGFDISAPLIARARQSAEGAGVADRAMFHEMAAEQLDFPADSFDMVIGTSILHHTDLEISLSKIRKVLKQDGTAIFLEPLNQNVLLRIWRLLTPWRRTATERAFTREDLARVRRLFPATRFTFFSFTAILTAGLLLLRPSSRLLESANERLEDIDEFALRTFPSLGRFSAVVVMEMRK
jgi:2-polyprenyl-3-methyl-5-hydroxy-6-metoxy-1,4-benzoquinol methylase